LAGPTPRATISAAVEGGGVPIALEMSSGMSMIRPGNMASPSLAVWRVELLFGEAEDLRAL
jgi:hypothetical protein